MFSARSPGREFVKLSRPPGSVLLIATRLIGDVLLNTPLLRSMRRSWPEARIDMLVFSGTAEILAGNPDCDEVITVDTRADAASTRKLLGRLWRRYDLAVTTQGGDRPYLYALLAARRRLGLIGDLDWKSTWKRVLAECVPLDNLHTHTVVQNLILAERLGISPVFEVVPPHDSTAETCLDQTLPFDWRNEPFAVLHPFPNWRYKRWTEAGWQGLLAHLRDRGWRVVLSGGPDAEERSSCAALASGWTDMVTNLAGGASFGTLSRLLAEARCYVGPDTSTTHLAAACGTPTVALYGPSNPVKWGPWPKGCNTIPSPWMTSASPWQQSGNVLILQGDEECVPCLHEGCDRHRQSLSRCLTELPATKVVAAVEFLLTGMAAHD